MITTHSLWKQNLSFFQKRGILGVFFVLLVSLAGSVLAQEAPVPRPAPRLPVNRQALDNEKDTALRSRDIQGQATVLDGEKLRIGTLDIRLLGIVAPQLSASFGPQARLLLDRLTAGQTVSCQVHDRDHEGRFLASCHTAGNVDLALELLKHGLAVTARGSLNQVENAPAYLTAEQAAQAQKTGLWFIPPQTVIAAPVKAAPLEPAKNEATPLTSLPTPFPSIAPALQEMKKETAKNELPAHANETTIINDLNDGDHEGLALPEESSFVMRYQILVTGFLMLLTGSCVMGALLWQRRKEKREEVGATAAALRGELMSARAVCLARLNAIVTEADDKTAAWPHIRSTLYAAYVGRLGWLGADLARQVASIYGQASDYAAYYNAVTEGKGELQSKRQALKKLISYIEEVLPRLAALEPYVPKSSPKSTFVTTNSTRGEKTVTEPVINETALPEENPEPQESSVWSAMKKIRHAKWIRKQEEPAEESHADYTDYTALIEEEMAHGFLSESKDVTEMPTKEKQQKLG